MDFNGCRLLLSARMADVLAAAGMGGDIGGWCTHRSRLGNVHGVHLQVIHIESCLKSSAVDRADLASLLRQVQELERNKLRLTLSW